MTLRETLIRVSRRADGGLEAEFSRNLRPMTRATSETG